MAKSTYLTAQEIIEAYNKLDFQDRLSVTIHCNQDMEAEKRIKGEELEALKKLESKPTA